MILNSEFLLLYHYTYASLLLWNIRYNGELKRHETVDHDYNASRKKTEINFADLSIFLSTLFPEEAQLCVR